MPTRVLTLFVLLSLSACRASAVGLTGVDVAEAPVLQQGDRAGGEHAQQRGAQDGAGSLGEGAPSWAPRRLGADAGALGFSAAEAFEGARPGFVFKMDELGLGYYREGSAPPAAAAVVNEEIDIDDDEDDGAQIQQVAVPAAVFGAAGMDVVASEAGNGMGALERFKRAQGL